jgi:hypothetical protein
MGTMDVGELLYDYTVKLTGMTEYGVSFAALMAGTVAPPPEGARFDAAFEGAANGPKLKNPRRRPIRPAHSCGDHNRRWAEDLAPRRWCGSAATGQSGRRPARERDPVHVVEGLRVGQRPSGVGHGNR